MRHTATTPKVPPDLRDPPYEVLAVRVPTRLARDVKLAAKADDRTLSGYLRRVLMAAVHPRPEREPELGAYRARSMKRTVTPTEAAAALGVKLTVTRKEGAAAVGLSLWAFDKLIAEGVLPVVRFPGSKDPEGRSRRVLIAVSDLEKLIETFRTKTG